MVRKERLGSFEQYLFRLLVLRIHLDALHRALHLAHGSLVKPNTLRAQLQIDDP